MIKNSSNKLKPLTKIDIYNEISEYLNIPFEVVEEQFMTADQKYGGFVSYSSISEKEWIKNNVSETNKEEVIDFYKTTPNYIYELMQNWANEQKFELINHVIDFFQKNNVKRVLSFGTGIGQEAIYLHQCGFIIDTIDLIGKTYDFAKWRFSKYKIKIDNSYNINESIVYEDILKNVEHYDCIFSFEVFNMLMDPEEEVKYLTRFIKIRGYLIYTAKFNNAYKLVLPRDNNYSNYFKKTLNNFNLFEVGTIPLWGEGVDKRYLHIFQKK